MKDRLPKRKNALTLLEVMIVIVLIGIIGSVIGFNMKGSLDEGRAFKTRQAQEQIHDILMLEVAAGALLQDVVASPEYYLEHSGLIKDGNKYVKDGWGIKFDIKLDDKIKDKLIVHSEHLEEYERKRKKEKD